jgi:hypothetical protein
LSNISGFLNNVAFKSLRLEVRYTTSVMASTRQCGRGSNNKAVETKSPGNRNERIWRITTEAAHPPMKALE